MAENNQAGSTGPAFGGVGTGPNLTQSGQALVPTFANQVHVITGAEVVRLTFGEALLGIDGIRFDTAVVIPTSMARGMADLILRMLTDQDAQLKKQAGG
jgi:hypothetical protein